MKKLLFMALLLAPTFAGAEHLDVMKISLDKNCPLAKYVAIKNDFNKQWGQAHGYIAEIASPSVGSEMTTLLWIGRAASSAAFGKAWDSWRDGLGKPKSLPARLNKRFRACSTIISRQSYDLF